MVSPDGGLPKCGICPTMAAAMRDGPISSGGAGMSALFHLQGTSRTAMIVEHCHKKSTTGQFLQICIEDLVMEVGMYNPLWNKKIEIYSSMSVTTH